MTTGPDTEAVKAPPPPPHRRLVSELVMSRVGLDLSTPAAEDAYVEEVRPAIVELDTGELTNFAVALIEIAGSTTGTREAQGAATTILTAEGLIRYEDLLTSMLSDRYRDAVASLGDGAGALSADVIRAMIRLVDVGESIVPHLGLDRQTYAPIDSAWDRVLPRLLMTGAVDKGLRTEIGTRVRAMERIFPGPGRAGRPLQRPPRS